MRGVTNSVGFAAPSAIYLYNQTVDFRKSINGLALIVEQDLGRNPFDPALFVFCNKTRDKLKCLYWDTTGFALWYKRLEKQRFKWPKVLRDKEMNLTPRQFQWLLSGYDIIGHQTLEFHFAS